MLQRLRTRVDAVMIGAGTMRAERYGRIVSDPQLRAYRERTASSHDPLAVIVSNRMELPWDAPLFTDGGGRVADLHRLREGAAADRDPGRPWSGIRAAVELDQALRALREERGIRSVLCEGGPTLHGRLRERDLADELFLTIAPEARRRRGATDPRGRPARGRELELVWLLDHDGELFARYRALPGLAARRRR